MKIILNTILSAAVMCFIVSAAYCQDSPVQTKQLVQDMYDKINAKDISGAMQNLDVNTVDHIPFVPNQKPDLTGLSRYLTCYLRHTRILNKQ